MAKAKKDPTDDAAATPTAKDAAAPKPKAASAKKAAAGATAPAKPAAAAAKKSVPAKAAKPTASPASKPLIDTDLAASAAASMVLNRGVFAGSSAAGGTAKESSTFRQLKESLAKPGASNLGGILGTGPIEKKKEHSHGPDRQVGRNQTFGADVSRASVPRRTSGG